MTEVSKNKEEKYKKLIITLSIVIPLVVAILFGAPKVKGVDTSFLPPIYALTNAFTAIALIMAVVAIKKGNRKQHERLMKLAVVLSSLFLVMYVIYHLTSESTAFGGEGVVKYVYYFILITHIILSITIIPFVLFTYVRAWAGSFDRHKKLAKITFPMWLYVAITGVIVYLMISPYYGS